MERSFTMPESARFSDWVGKGAVVMATLAALSLAVTVVLAGRALERAADTVALGEGESLVSGVVDDLWQTDGPLSSPTLAAIVRRHEGQGLRYLGLLDRHDHHVLLDAGHADLATSTYVPNTILRRGHRARVLSLIPPQSETRVTHPVHGPREFETAPRPMVVVELDSPLVDHLQRDSRRLGIVALVAATVLVAFAFAWSRTHARLVVEQERAESERRWVALGGASSVIAHEIRNPLAALKGHAQLLVEDLEGSARAKAERVVQGAERLEHLTTVLTSFVKDTPLAAHPVKTADLVERAMGPLMRDLVHTDLSAAPDTVDVDERLVLALRNILENACHVTSPESPALLRVFEEGGATVLEVRDHGPGLPEGAEQSVFEPFMTTRSKGTGLGLSIARRIVEQHRGSLTGRTHPEGGAEFRIVIPR